MKQLGKKSLDELVEVLYACARYNRVITILNRHQLPNDQPKEELLNLCMHLSPQKIIEEVLEEEERLKEFCEFLEIPYQLGENKSELLNDIKNYIFEPIPSIIGFSTIYRYVESYDDTKKELIPYAFEAAKRIEGLLVDVYRLYIGCIFYKYLNEVDRCSVKNTFNNSRNNGYIQISVALNQLEKYGSIFSGENFLDIQEDLRIINNQSSFLDNYRIDLVRDIANIRNQYLAHPSDSSPQEITNKARAVLEKAKEFLLNGKDTFPKVVLPLQYGVSEWGFKYIAYIDENDVDVNGQIADERIDIGKCRRFYLYKTVSEFRPYQKAFCLQNTQNTVIRDPKIYYFADIRNLILG